MRTHRILSYNDSIIIDQRSHVLFLHIPWIYLYIRQNPKKKKSRLIHRVFFHFCLTLSVTQKFIPHTKHAYFMTQRIRSHQE